MRRTGFCAAAVTPFSAALKDTTEGMAINEVGSLPGCVMPVGSGFNPRVYKSGEQTLYIPAMRAKVKRSLRDASEVTLEK